MTLRNVFVVLLVMAGLGSIDSSARAQPDPATSIVPQFINVVGFRAAAGDVPDAVGAFTVTVNDALGAAIVGDEVVLDFAACTDMCLCTYAVPGQTVACDATCRGTVTAITGVGGVAAFQVLGAGLRMPAVPPAVFPGPGTGCIAISAGPPGGPYVALGTATCVHLDINGALGGAGNNGLNGLDYTFIKDDIGAAILGAPYRGRSDWSMNGTINGADISAFRLHLFRAAAGIGSAGGCSSAAVIDYCP